MSILFNFRNSARIVVGTSFLPLTAFAADASQMELNLLIWINSLPEWVPALFVAILFAGLALAGLAFYRYVRRTSNRSLLASASAALGGAILGTLVALLGTDAWQSFLYTEISQLPPTAAGIRTIAALPPDLLGEPDAADATTPPKMPQKVLPDRARDASVNFDAIDADSLTLNLFDDTTLIAVRDRVVKNMQGGSAWVGHIENEPDSLVTLAAKGKALMGTVEWSGRSFEIVYVGGNTHAVREIDPDKIPGQFEPDGENEPGADLTDGDTTSTSTSTATSTSGSTTNTGEVIDVLVVYTPKARANAGGVSGIETKIMNAVTRANQAYLNSQINMQLNLVAMAETAYTETGDMVAALGRLTNPTDGYMDEVQSLRNQYAADQVALIDTDSNYCGYANTMTSSYTNTSFAPKAFAVVHDDSIYNCLASNNTLAHELGHNQGNVHNTENAGFAGAYPDSYGYRICGSFRDIMSYACTSEVRIPYFSNPNILYNNQPTGIAGTYDTARSMNATAPIVASFRTPTTTTTTTVTPTVPNAPSNLNATVASTSGITLAWADNASDETGYYVQRSPDGATWSLIATLGSNTVSFADSGLTAGTAYSYRVYAYNSVGNSGFSNIASATTQALADTAPPTVTISKPSPGTKVSGNVAISVSAADNVGISSLKLYIDGKLLGSSNTGSLSYTWNTNQKTVAAGSHTISAQAADGAGNAGTASVSVTK